MPYVNMGIERVLLDADGIVKSRIKIIAPIGITFPIADETATPVWLAVYPNNVWIDNYITLAFAEAAIFENGGGS